MASPSPSCFVMPHIPSKYQIASRKPKTDSTWRAPKMVKPRSHRGNSRVLVKLLEQFIKHNLPTGTYPTQTEFYKGINSNGWVEVEVEPDTQCPGFEHGYFVLYNFGVRIFEFDAVFGPNGVDPEALTVSLGEDCNTTGIDERSLQPLPIVTERVNACLATLQFHDLLHESLRLRMHRDQTDFYGGSWEMAGIKMGGG